MVHGSELIHRENFQIIEAPRQTSVAALLLLGLAFCLAAVGLIAGNPSVITSLLFIALLPLLLAGACFLTCRRIFVAELGQDALHVHQPKPIQVPYASFLSVQREGGGKGGQFPIHIQHEAGVISIPANTSIASQELLRVLAGKIPSTVLQQLPDELLAIYEKHAQSFGVDRVYAFPTRQSKIKGFRGLRGMAVSAAFILSGMIWLVTLADQDKRHDPPMLGALGGVLILFGFLGFVYYHSKRALFGGFPKWKNSGIVVSPVGIAMIQDKERGELKWNELVKLSYAMKPPSFLTTSSTASPTHIRLVFNGGVAAVLDIYTHPLVVIYEHMKEYWGRA
jgi:hypothetical protein